MGENIIENKERRKATEELSIKREAKMKENNNDCRNA